MQQTILSALQHDISGGDPRAGKSDHAATTDHTKPHEHLAYLDQLVLSLCPCTLLSSPQYAFVLLGIDIYRFLLHHTTWQLDALLRTIRRKLIGGLPQACASQP